ncbi:hypothetical protein EMCRGX_G015877 [Ephydatia muelleri]
MHFRFVPQDEQDKEANLRDEWLKQSRAVPGTQTLHSFVPVTTCTVKAKPFSSNEYSRNENVALAAISQPCLYNYTIDGTQTVIVNQSSPVCLICSNTAFDKWFVGSLYPGIAGAPYIFYVESPVATLLSVFQVGCYSLPGQEDLISSTIGVAVPVISHIVTYVNETDHLTLVSSNVITATPSVIALSGRSWLDPKGSSIRLLASPAGIITGLVPFVNRTAAGNYTCVARLVANANGVTTVTGTTLVVVYYPPTVLSPQPTVYMVQGRTIQLNCTFDGLPAPNVIWTHPNGSVITSQSRFTIQTTSTSSSLTITSLVGGGDTGTYTCKASNFRGVSSNTVQLFVQVPPDPPSNVMVTSVGNSSLSLSWTNGFDGFSPLSNVVISYEVDRYPQEGTQAQTFPMGTSATLFGLHPYSNYTLHVSVTNAVGFISNPTNITVTTLSLRPMAPAITSVVAMNSTQVTIMWTTCIAGAPYILYVTTPTTTFASGSTVACDPSVIYYSSVQIAAPVVPPVVTYVNETDPLSLISTASLSSINRVAAGNYTCVTKLVANANGVTNVNVSTLVVVYYPPTVLSPQPTVYMVQGRTIQLNCTFDGLPAPNVIWTHPNGSVITSQSRFTTQTTSTSSSLTITSLVGGGDTGTYTCTASNLWGVSSNTVQLFVQVPPDPPSNVMVTSVGNSSLSLSWTNGFDGFSPLSNVVISYEVDRYPQEGTQAQTFPMGTSATLVGLYPYSNYTLHVSVTNAVGFISNPTNITVTTLSLRPMAPAITSVVAMNSTQVTIMWTVSI